MTFSTTPRTRAVAWKRGAGGGGDMAEFALQPGRACRQLL